MSVQVSIQVLGGFRLTVDGQPVAALPRKAQALLAYLAMQDGRPVTRETVADLLWTDRGVEQARGSLKTALYEIRKPLSGVIGNDPRMLAFVPGMVETDVGRFRLLARSGDRAELAEAAQVYEGALLDRFPPVGGDFDDWVRTAREELNDQAIEVMRRLVDACLADGDVHPAVLVAEQMVALDLLREDSHRRLIEVYLRAGRRADAIRQYDVCVEVLRQELDVGPSAETEALGRGLRDDGSAAQTREKTAAILALSNFEGPPRVAVLPFDQMGSSVVPEHIRDGLAEDIVQQLAGLRALSVISHGTTRQFRDNHQTLDDIGRRINARYIVRGNVRRSGNAVRLIAELTDAVTSEVLWARTHDTTVSLSFDDQDRIVSQVINSLAPRVIDAEIVRIRGKRVTDLSVYEKALLARDYIARLGHENFLAAQDLMNDVMRQAPMWGEAYALAADCHGMLLGEAWSQSRGHHLSEIGRLTNIALKLDPENVRALMFYGHRKTIFYREHEAAAELFRRALEAAPNSAQAWLWSSYTYTYMGNAAEAVKRAEQALSLSPSDREAYWFYLGLCTAYYTLGEYDLAVEWGHRALAEPLVGQTGPRRVVASLVGAGRIDEARDLARWVMDQGPKSSIQQIVASSPYRDEEMRVAYGRHLAVAGFPD